MSGLPMMMRIPFSGVLNHWALVGPIMDLLSREDVWKGENALNAGIEFRYYLQMIFKAAADAAFLIYRISNVDPTAK